MRINQGRRILVAPLFLLALVAARSAGAQKAPPARLAASIHRIFGSGASFDSVAVDSLHVLRVTQGDSLLGFAEVSNVKGKDQPITFLVAIDPSDHLKDVDVLVYREPYGGQVAYEQWRRQFRGLTAADSVRVGHPIRSISGATISVHAVTSGVRRVLAQLTDRHRRGLLQ
ncbi:MAG TPA: FMN-binding protein [Gemmatimonadales bacterium]|nr:FMN-binding protein [Gemmatimonadales bacterium]